MYSVANITNINKYCLFLIMERYNIKVEDIKEKNNNFNFQSDKLNKLYKSNKLNIKYKNLNKVIKNVNINQPIKNRY